MIQLDKIEWDEEPKHKSSYGSITLSKCGKFAYGHEWNNKTGGLVFFCMNIENGYKNIINIIDNGTN